MATTHAHPIPGVILLRAAASTDHEAIADLAALDSSAQPAAPLLVAEVDGAMRAVVSLADGAAIADPFHPTAELVGLLRTLAAAA